MIQRNVVWKLLLSALVPVLLVAASCPPSASPSPVIIAFEQIGACNGYRQTTGPGGSGPHSTVSAGAGGAFVAFRVLELDNSSSGQVFQFDPERIYVSGSSPQAHVDTDLQLARDFGFLSVAPVVVPVGARQGNSGIAVVRVSAAGHAAEANATNYFLSYESGPGDPPVFLSKRDPGRTSWPQTDDCRAIRF